MFGFINIYKPKGMTSHDVVSVLRRITKIKQIGHTGTLDPFAEGVLPICIGKATRLIEYLEDEKEYLATVQFGTATTTYDPEGEITSTSDKKITKEELLRELENFRGEISQLPPIYSAIKIKGKKLYEYARKGETVKIQPRKVFISKLELKNFDETNQTAELLIGCSKGTYIRSIAHDLGQNLKCGGHLTKLVRTKAGKFTIKNANHLDNLNVPESLINPLNMLSLPQIELTKTQHEKILHGQQIENNSNFADFVILIYNNAISAVGFANANKIAVKKVFE